MRRLEDFMGSPYFRSRILPALALDRLGAEVVLDELLRVECIRMPEGESRGER